MLPSLLTQPIERGERGAAVVALEHQTALAGRDLLLSDRHGAVAGAEQQHARGPRRCAAVVVVVVVVLVVVPLLLGAVGRGRRWRRRGCSRHIECTRTARWYAR